MGEEKDPVRINGNEIQYILKTGTTTIRDDNTIQKHLLITPELIVIHDVVVTSQANIFKIDQPRLHLILRNVSFEEAFSLEDTTISLFELYKCEFYKTAELNGLKVQNTLRIDDCTFHSNVTFLECTSTLQTFKSNYSKIIFFGGSVKYLLLNDSKVQGLILRLASVEQIELKNSNVEDIEGFRSTISSFNLYDSEIRNFSFAQVSNHSLSLWRIAIIERFSIQRVVSTDIIDIQESHITYFDLLPSEFKKLKITETNLVEVNLSSDIPKDAFLFLGGCSLTKLTFNFIRNYGIIELSELTLTERREFSIQYSDLGKTNLINNNFKSVKFQFNNSKISECFLAETDFSKDVYRGDNISHEQAQLAFGQLQTAYQRQGDNVRASEYQAREIEAHYETISWKTHFPTKLSLLLNRLSNDYGRNWARGVAFSILIGLLVFYCLILSSEEFYFAWNISHVPALTDSFLKFMNPLRHFETENLFADKRPVINATAGTYILDFLGRIFVTYGYYQTIQAFRRFGKK